jgi:diaminopimelate epimerase
MQMFKAHGTGNDFVVIPDPDGVVDLDATAVTALCDRRLGIGADGVIRLAPSPDGHVFMDYRNGGDGSIVEMCGNGVRVVAAHLVEHGWTDDRVLRIDTRDGVKRATVTTDAHGTVTEVSVDMGRPRFGASDIPFESSLQRTDGFDRFEVDGHVQQALTVSMGNPHAVLLVDDPETAPVRTLGPRIASSASFPAGTNVEFVTLRDRRRIDLRVWERGVGETLACGTGVCGAVAALITIDALDAGVDVDVHVRGGLLRVRWDGGADDGVHLAGPAVEIAALTPDPRWLAQIGLQLPTPQNTSAR